MLTIAIDPGASGGIATSDTLGVVRVYKMPETPKDIHDLLFDLRYTPCVLPTKIECRAVVESISMGLFAPGEDVSGKSKMVAMFKLHRHCGQLEGFLLALGIPFESVSPQKWMAHHGVMPKDRAKRKRHIKDIVQRKYPEIRVILNTADALGILTYTLEREK